MVRESHKAKPNQTVVDVLKVLFTDIVDSTRSAATMGDRDWRKLLDRHDELALQVVEKHRGTLIKSSLEIVRPETVIRWHRAGFRSICAGNQDCAVAVQRPRWKSVSSSARSASPTH